MCDYSLHAQPNRLAKEGEELVLTIFRGGSRGFASRQDVDEQTAWEQRRARPKIDWSWKGLMALLKSRTIEEPRKPLMVVCIPPGAQLQLEGIPPSMQRDLGVKSAEKVTFTQLSCEAYTYRDAVRFDNGKEVLLQWLKEKQRAVVLSLGSKPEIEEPIEITAYSTR